MKHTIRDGIFALPAAIFLGILVFRLVQFRKLLDFFPLYSDLATHIPSLSFLKEFGYHQTVPYWYQGFTLFQSYPPGWFFAALPFYLWSGNLQVALYGMLLVTYLLGLGCILLGGRWAKLSLLKRLALFSLFFGSPPMIDYLTIGRAPELLAWSLFSLAFLFLEAYRAKPLDRTWWLIIPLGAAVLLIHVYTFVMLAGIFGGLYLTKRKWERWAVGGAGLAIMAVTSVWWLPFLLHHESGTPDLGWMINWSSSSLISFNTVSVVAFLALGLHQWKGWSRTERRFYLPPLLLGLLLLTRMIVLVPVLNLVLVTSYTALFIFLSAFLLLRSRVSLVEEDVVRAGLLLATVASALLVLFYLASPLFEHTERDQSLIALLQEGHGTFLVLRQETLAHPHPLNAYGAAVLKRSTPSGNHYPAIPARLEHALQKTFASAQEGDCMQLQDELRALEVDQVLSYEAGCLQLASCSWQKGEMRGSACSFMMPGEKDSRT